MQSLASWWVAGYAIINYTHTQHLQALLLTRHFTHKKYAMWEGAVAVLPSVLDTALAGFHAGDADTAEVWAALLDMLRKYLGPCLTEGMTSPSPPPPPSPSPFSHQLTYYRDGLGSNQSLHPQMNEAFAPSFSFFNDANSFPPMHPHPSSVSTLANHSTHYPSQPTTYTYILHIDHFGDYPL